MLITFEVAKCLGKIPDLTVIDIHIHVTCSTVDMENSHDFIVLQMYGQTSTLLSWCYSTGSWLYALSSYHMQVFIAQDL